MSENSTHLLVVNGKPVLMAGIDDDIDLYEYVMEHYGPFTGEPYEGRIDTLDGLLEWCSIHSGIFAPLLALERVEAPGEPFDFYIVSSPGYAYNLDDGEREAVEAFYAEHGVEVRKSR